MEDEYGLDGVIEIGTDDEQIEAQTYYFCNASTDDDDCINPPHSDVHHDDGNHVWPQTYRYTNYYFYVY